MTEDNTTTDQTPTMNTSSTPPPIMDIDNTPPIMDNSYTLPISDNFRIPLTLDIDIEPDSNKQYDNDNANANNDSSNYVEHYMSLDKVDIDDTTDNTAHDAYITSETRYSAERYTFAVNKNIAEGMMDIALLSANANQLRFLITYNREATFFYISLILVIVSLLLQLAVGIGLLIRRRYRLKINKEPYKTNTFIVGGVFVITMVNILLAALTTTDNNNNNIPKT